MPSQLFVLLAVVFAVYPARSATNTISGTVAFSTRWSGTNLLVGAVTVESNAVVTIAAGTRVLMDAESTLVVRGQLLAAGTQAEPIYFTRERAGERWKGIRFIRSAPSRFGHCVFEFADSEGSHLDYYDDDCDPATIPPSRTYHEAVVALASELAFESCVFQNLPDSAGSREGDAIAIISDDPGHPGPASAHVNHCRFISIGQGIHSRYSHLLVENSFFTDHHGDNDDIDMYGESVPPPLIRYNRFLNAAHDDAINPTRCSAIILGNIISGGDDHGVVLRDKCTPLVMNNFIANFASAGIAVQNQCDALIVNNTIVDCARGIRFFDHDQRWAAPYCLFPGSGRATIVNTIIWNSATPLHLADRPYTQDRGSQATVLYSNIEGGRTRVSVSANSSLIWAERNTAIDPGLTNQFRLSPASPMIDAGVNISLYVTNPIVYANLDPDGIARPLDGDGDRVPRYDLGASEFLLASADSNGDGIPDGWLHEHDLELLNVEVLFENPDGDAHNTIDEWIADTNPIDARSVFIIKPVQANGHAAVQFLSSSNRLYTLQSATNLTNPAWQDVAGATAISGTETLKVLNDTSAVSNRFYRIRVELAP